MKLRAVVASFAVVLVAVACGDSPAADPASSDPPPPPPRPPNVIILVMDTTRADRLSVMGYRRPTTPNLAALAKESVLYRNAWVPAGWTGPSHASLFTGLRPVHHGYIEPRRPLLHSNAVTLAEILFEAGYRTACLSNNLLVGEEFGLTQGYTHAPRIALLQDRPLPHSRDVHNRALAYIRTARDAGVPFHVYINDFEPHLPYEPSEAFQDRLLVGTPDAALVAAARAWNNPATIAHLVGQQLSDPAMLEVLPNLYDAEIAELDAEIGTFVEALRAEGVLNDTLLVVMGDHGENLGEHGLWDHRFSLHRSICHVPLIVRYPGAARAGTVVDDIVRTEDIFPTVLEVCGLPVPKGLDGESLLGDLHGRISRASYGPQLQNLPNFQKLFPGVDPPQFHYAIRSVFDGRHHLMVRSDGFVELYDVPADPDEATNLAADDPATVERLRLLLDE